VQNRHMAKEERRRFCIDMETEIIMRRRLMDYVCTALGKRMPSWAELARRSINTLETELKIECSEKGMDFNELLSEANPYRYRHDRPVTDRGRKYFLDED
jgi:hypothetical protein